MTTTTPTSPELSHHPLYILLYRLLVDTALAPTTTIPLPATIWCEPLRLDTDLATRSSTRRRGWCRTGGRGRRRRRETRPFGHTTRPPGRLALLLVLLLLSCSHGLRGHRLRGARLFSLVDLLRSVLLGSLLRDLGFYGLSSDVLGRVDHLFLLGA